MDIQGTQSELIGYRAQSGYRFSFLCPVTRRLIVGETGTGVRQLAALHLRALRRGILHDWDKNITHAEWLVASKEIHRQVRGL